MMTAKGKGKLIALITDPPRIRAILDCLSRPSDPLVPAPARRLPWALVPGQVGGMYSLQEEQFGTPVIVVLGALIGQETLPASPSEQVGYNRVCLIIEFSGAAFSSRSKAS